MKRKVKWAVVTDGDLYVRFEVGDGPKGYDVAQAAASAVARMLPGVTVSGKRKLSRSAGLPARVPGQR
jgi:hypothetical protein